MQNSPLKFTLTQDHLALLKNTNVLWIPMEFGAPGINPKRPYGNSNVLVDVCNILDLDYNPTSTGDYDENHPNLVKAKKLHEETQFALEIILNTQSFEPGVYIKESPYEGSWIKE